MVTIDDFRILQEETKASSVGYPAGWETWYIFFARTEEDCFVGITEDGSKLTLEVDPADRLNFRNPEAAQRRLQSALENGDFESYGY